VYCKTFHTFAPFTLKRFKILCKYIRDISFTQTFMQEKSLIKKNILQYIEYKCISKYNFYQKTGITRGILDQNNGMSEENTTKFLAFFPEVNPEWLILGIGDMIKRDISSNNSTISPISLTYDDKLVKIPIIETELSAGLGGFINGRNIVTTDYMILPANMVKDGINLSVLVKGDSMSPTLFDSDRIIVHMLDKSEWLEMRDKHVYAIVDTEGRGYIKRVKNRLSKGFIVCMSDNLDKSNYPNFNLQHDQIISIWYADLRLSAKMPNINDNYTNRLKQLEYRMEDITNMLSKSDKSLEK